MKAPGPMPVNAIELELFRHFLVSIAEEMGVVLRQQFLFGQHQGAPRLFLRHLRRGRRDRCHGRPHAGAPGRDAAVGARRAKRSNLGPGDVAL